MRSGMKHIGLMLGLSALLADNGNPFKEPIQYKKRPNSSPSRPSTSKFKFAGNGVPKNQRQRRKLDRQVPERRKAA